MKTRYTEKEIELAKRVLDYYRESLRYDTISGVRFGPGDFVDQAYREISPSSPFFYFDLKNHDALRAVVRHCARKNRETWERLGKPREGVESRFRFFYAPMLVPFPSEPGSEMRYFAPFYVEFLQPSWAKKSGKKRRFAKGLDGVVALRFKVASRTDIYDAENDKDFFGHSSMEVNLALFGRPFYLLDEEFMQRLSRARERRGRTGKIETYSHLIESMALIFEAIDGGYAGLDSTQKRIERFLGQLEEARNKTASNTYSHRISFESAKLGTFVFVVDTAELDSSDKYNGGMLNLYAQMLDDGRLDTSGNLFLDYLIGSPIAKAPVPDESMARSEEGKGWRFKRFGIEDRVALARKQYGAFDANYALTKSQRYALQVAKSGLSIVPVSGPPGTGKTSLLRAFVADYVVESALRVIRQKDEGREFDEIEFPPPIAAFSTNNQAQRNIIEGMTEGYLSAKKAGPFYQRWLDASIDFKEFETVDGIGLYVPMLKSSFSDDGDLSLTINNLLAIRLDIRRKAEERAKEFLEKAQSCLQDFATVEVTHANAKRLLHKLYRRLAADIRDKIEKIEKEIHIAVDEKLERFEKNLSLLETAARLAHRDDLAEDIAEDTKSEGEMALAISDVENFIGKAESLLRQRSEEHREVVAEQERAQKSAAAEAKAEFESHSAEIGAEYGKQIEEAGEKSKEEKTNFSRLQSDLRRIEEQLAAIESERKRFFAKIWPWTRQRLRREAELMADEAEQARAEIREAERRIRGFEKEARDLSDKRDVAISRAKQEADRRLRSRVDGIIDEINKRWQKREAWYAEAFADMGFDDAEAAERAVETFSKVEKSGYFGPEDALRKLEETSAGLDTSLRLHLFFASMHLLETVLLLKMIEGTDREVCPACGKPGVAVGEKLIKHDACGFKMRRVVPDGRNGERRLSDGEIERVLTGGMILSDHTYYAPVENREGWYNMQAVYGASARETLSQLRDLLPLFPLLNTTAQSFFSVFSYKDKAVGKKVLPEGFFEYLFVDEAGMVLPSLMANLYAGRKVLLFGDEKQIEPVYPFGGDEIVDEVVADRAAEGDGTLREMIRDGYSLLKMSAMSLANRALYIEDKNAVRADKGAPIWLLQHFRCKDPIVTYCNKLVYDGKIEPLAGEDEEMCHLVFVEHAENMSTEHNICTAEAEIVAELVNEHLFEGYGLDEIGVITPYRNQAEAIKRTLAKQGYDTNTIQIGTVHKFQGSERRVILFSTSSGANSPRRGAALFMNRDRGNMLNVAVSRAKERFVLIGCREIIAPDNICYSGMLVEHIESWYPGGSCLKSHASDASLSTLSG
ncbi:DEAD/DEAH box helicase [Hydrogenimonas cancrithermarum]|uniref:DNA2/NAM7 helicase-like C-terminal domain-containing protein n=1 Tax=Hydrogenimonas cancrithermarum TaxID=2993563 RepID=A0ABM8FNQ9_9BACT|nr:AAA domain-containing protein [Hydrogenimonas cancrithermarum]BDY13984.1 hypothetical protein HCR_22970 [Hydrogenimonas cancrithermarum]